MARTRRGRHMATMNTIAQELASLETEGERVFSWRHAALLTAGYETRIAFKLALRPEVDLHRAITLRRVGCPSATAARILI
jgi:hypothetical protein